MNQSKIHIPFGIPFATEDPLTYIIIISLYLQSSVCMLAC